MERSGAEPGDRVSVRAGRVRAGILMPGYGGHDALVLKLDSGYNVGISAGSVESVEVLEKARPAPARRRAGAARPDLPRILLVSTGGTIASRVDYRTGAVTPALDADQMYEYAPELGRIADVRTCSLLSKHSEDMAPADWLAVAEKVRQEAPNYAGIVIAHGTDTMHYTSAFLSFALAGLPVPVALVGAQRSPDRASSDAAENLLGAARLVAGCGANGIYVVMHEGTDDGAVACHAGTRVRKNHTSARGAFETVGGPPAFTIRGGDVSRSIGRFFQSDSFEPRIALSEKVALVKCHPGYGADAFERAAEGAEAVIIEGTGLGHAGSNLLPAVRAARRAGAFVGMTSQCIAGRTNMNVYGSGRDLLEAGAVPLADMLPETALVKAMWAAGAGDPGELMLQKIASEFSD